VPGPGLSADQVAAARREAVAVAAAAEAAVARAAVGLGPGASEAELRAAQATWPQLLAMCGLEAGAPAGKVRAALNKKDADGELPIHRALCDVATGPELVRAMLDLGGEAMLGVVGSYKQLPLHCAAAYSQSAAVVRLVLARGPSQRGAGRAKNASGSTPLGLAKRANAGPAEAEIVALLRAAAFPNADTRSKRSKRVPSWII
jgi:hypothetical protein